MLCVALMLVFLSNSPLKNTLICLMDMVTLQCMYIELYGIPHCTRRDIVEKWTFIFNQPI